MHQLAAALDLTGNPIVVWAGAVVVALSYAALASRRLQQLLGPLGRWLAARQIRRIRRAEEVTDARITDMGEQITYLKSELAEVRAEMRTWRHVIAEHARWDRQVAHQLRDLLGETAVPDPPPLYPDDTTSPTGS